MPSSSPRQHGWPNLFSWTAKHHPGFDLMILKCQANTFGILLFCNSTNLIACVVAPQTQCYYIHTLILTVRFYVVHNNSILVCRPLDKTAKLHCSPHCLKKKKSDGNSWWAFTSQVLFYGYFLHWEGCIKVYLRSKCYMEPPQLCVSMSERVPSRSVFRSSEPFIISQNLKEYLKQPFLRVYIMSFLYPSQLHWPHQSSFWCYDVWLECYTGPASPPGTPPEHSQTCLKRSRGCHRNWTHRKLCGPTGDCSRLHSHQGPRGHSSKTSPQTQEPACRDHTFVQSCLFTTL